MSEPCLKHTDQNINPNIDPNDRSDYPDYTDRPDAPEEACGVFGVFSTESDVVTTIVDKNPQA
jgi:hypothetical protein